MSNHANVRTKGEGRLLAWAPAVMALLNLLLAGCGSGGGERISNCDLNAFTPNYAHNLSHLLNWSRFPVSVYFVRDANYSVRRETLARSGFDSWVSATGGVLTYTVASSPNNVDIIVRFDPTTPDGVTRITFVSLSVTHADVTLGVQNLPDADVTCVASHEFAHALGVDGHSDVPDDLMFPVHVVGAPCPITPRDLNTLKTGYCALFGRGVPAPLESPAGPVRTKVIH